MYLVVPLVPNICKEGCDVLAYLELSLSYSLGPAQALPPTPTSQLIGVYTV